MSPHPHTRRAEIALRKAEAALRRARAMLTRARQRVADAEDAVFVAKQELIGQRSLDAQRVPLARLGDATTSQNEEE